MGLAKHFEEQLERFLTNTDEIRRDFSGQKAIYGPEIVEQKANSIQRAMRNLCDELLSIVTKPEYQDALAIDELSREMQMSNQKHQNASEHQASRIKELERHLARLQTILKEKDLFIEELKKENADLQDTVSARNTKIANIHHHYNRLAEKTTDQVPHKADQESEETKELEVPELSFKELLEQAAQSADIKDKRK